VTPFATITLRSVGKRQQGRPALVWEPRGPAGQAQRGDLRPYQAPPGIAKMTAWRISSCS